MNGMTSISLTSRQISPTSIVIVFLILDLFILVCRVACTIDTSQQILDGCILQKTYSNKYSE